MTHPVLLVLLTIVLATSAATSTAVTDITYNIQNYSSQQEGYSLSGTITTDGKEGTLSATDITGWSVTVSGGHDGFTETVSGVGAGVTIDNLVATSTRLTLADPGPSGLNSLNLSGPQGYISWMEGGADVGQFNEYIAQNRSSDYTNWNTGPSDSSLGGPPWLIAQAQISSAPEPGTLTMVLLCFACVAVAQSLKQCSRPAKRPQTSMQSHS